MNKFTEQTEKSENLIKEGHFYSLDDIKTMIPMLDDITYNLLFLRFNKDLLTDKEIEDTNIIIKRLKINQEHYINDIKEKFEKNQIVEELEEITIDEDENNEKKEI
jgi:hypothetical protein